MQTINYTMEEMIPIVAKLTEQYTGHESTSVTYETANQLMGAVIYCIREYETASDLQEVEIGRREADAEEKITEKGKVDAGIRIAQADKVTAKEAYELGCRLVDSKVRRMKDLYHALLLDFHAYGNIALKETAEAIPEFLKWYDIKYEPQNTILTLDYPVLIDLRQYSGIDAVFEYVKCLSMEQRFLNRFPDAYVTDTLRAYSEEYEEMFENLCGILLADIVRHILIKKPLDGDGLTEGDRDKVRAVLGMYSAEEAKKAVRIAVRNFIREFCEDDVELWNYVKKECDNITTREIHSFTEK